MKKIIAVLIALVIFIIPVFAENVSDITLTYNDGITFYSEGDEVLGIEKESFSKYIKDNNIIVYGIADDSSFVVEVICNETPFSKSIKDFNNINLIDIKDFADSMGILTYTIKPLGNASYIVSETVSQNSQNEGVVTQYITIKQDKLYVVTFTASDSLSDSDYKEKIVSGINYNFSDEPQQISVWYIVIVSVIIILILIFSVWILATVIKDLKKRKAEKIKGE